MVLTDFLTETRRRWLKAFKLFKRNRSRKCVRNRVSPLPPTAAYSGTVDARSEIDLQVCPCRTSLPPPVIGNDVSYENASYYSSFNSYDSSCPSLPGSECGWAGSDSAYDSARSSPRHPVCYATVTYFNVNDSEDSSSIRTEYTILEEDDRDDERAQNLINESLELVSSL